VAIASSESLADSSRADIVEQYVQCAQSSMHVAESAAPFGSSRLQSSLVDKLRKQKLINSFTYCLQKHCN